MKKSFTLILMLLAVFALCSTAMAADYTGYTEFNSETGTLTFYGTTGTVPSSSGTKTIRKFGKFEYSYSSEEYADQILHAVIDYSFRNVVSDYARCWFKGLKNLKSVNGLGNLKHDSNHNDNFKEMFMNCSSLEDLGDIYNLVTKYASSCYRMFYGCTSLKKIDFSGKDFTGVEEDFQDMFYGCTSLEEAIFTNAKINTVKDFDDMFNGCTSLRIVNFDGCSTEKLTWTQRTFKGCENLVAIFVGSGFTVDKVSKSGDMFKGCTKLQGFPNGVPYKYENKTDKSMATTSGGYLSLPSDNNNGYVYFYKNTLHICYDKYMLPYTSWTNCWDATNTGTSNPGWLSYSLLTTKAVVDFNARSFKPKSTAYWFYEFSNLKELENFDSWMNLSDATTTAYMFAGCRKLQTIKVGNSTMNQSADMSHMFDGCTALRTVSLPSRTEPCKMNHMFYNCTNLQTIPFFGTAGNATDLSYMFYGCTGLTGQQKMTCTTDQCTDMSYMFYGCTNITSLQFSCSMKSVTTTERMFAGCTNIQKIYLLKTSDKTLSLANTKSMFYNDSKLKRIYVEKYDYDLCVDNVTTNNSYMMFNGCTSLIGGKGSKYSVSYDGKTYARIDKGSSASLKGYFTPYNSTITFNTDGGSGNSDGLYNAERSCAIADSEKKGYVFLGWTCSGGYSQSTPTKDLIIPALDVAYPITCTAHFAVDFATNSDVKIYFKRSGSSSFTYDNLDLALGVLFNGKWLTEGKDYTIDHSTVKWANTYSITVTGIASNGFTGTKTSKVYVNKASVTIQVDNASKTYGDPDPEFSYSVNGLKGSDNIKTIKLARVVAVDAVGSTGILVDSYSVDNEANYNISIKRGSLTINPKPITVTPVSTSKTYGDADPSFTYTVDGLVDDDKLTGYIKRMPGEQVGDYEFDATSLYNKNYSISIASGAKFSITPKDITVTPNTVSKVYGDPDPVLTYTVDGLKDGDQLTGSLSREAGEDVGEYSISSSLQNSNYNITLSDIKFEITQKSISSFAVILDPAVSIYDGSQQKPTVKLFDGTKEIPSTEYAVSYGENKDKGEGTVTISNKAGGNYVINNTVATFDIIDQSEACTVYIHDGSSVDIIYAAPDQPLTKPIKEGYTVHAYTDQAHTTEWNYSDKVTTKTLALYLVWVENTHTITYKVDGEADDVVTLKYGEQIPAKASTKTGHSLVWDINLPSTMPDYDIVTTGTYIKNVHTLTYKLDGEDYYFDNLEYESAITPLAAPTAREGYTFSGWSGLPATMPDEDVTATGSFTANKHTLVFTDNGTAVKTITDFAFGSDITAEVPVKEFHSYIYELPSTGKLMPDADVTINGKFETNKHNLVYILDGVEYKNTEVAYGTALTLLANPDARTGYTFSGWNGLPATMPDDDVYVSGEFTANPHSLVFKVDGEEQPAITVSYDTKISTVYPQKTGFEFVPSAEAPSTMPDENITIEGTFEYVTYYVYYYVDGAPYISEEHHYGDALALIDAPENLGCTFSGWSELPATMPANNVTVEGTFTPQVYTLTYKIDGEVYKTYTKGYGSYISSLSAKIKTGYTFSGWDNEPSEMPASDLVVNGSYIKNKYTITYLVDGEEYKTEEVEYEAAIAPTEAPTKEGYTFSGWNLVYETMPAFNITISGSFTENSTTPVASITQSEDIKVWSFNHTIYIETAPDTKYTIVDLQGRVITTSTTKSTHNEIQINQSGIMIVIIGNQSFKLVL
ncbi:MAG: InlB B-repeat-containing protein [Bacteroidales bacterium]|nr:InlB B-repeat-containing protein [Bacteroidales bacterium]